MLFRPVGIEGLSLRAGALYNNSKYTWLANLPCHGGQMISEGGNLLYSAAANGDTGGFTAQDRSGVPLTRAPRCSASTTSCRSVKACR